MEDLVGMKVSRKREGKKIVECPRRLTFYNSEGKEVLEIHISEHTKEMFIFPRGAEITIFEHDLPLRKHTQKDRGTNVVSNNPLGNHELIFPSKEEKEEED